MFEEADLIHRYIRADAHLSARIKRLEALAIGFNRELSIIGEGNDPMLYLERQAYLGAIRHAVSGLESARVTRAKARQRLRDMGQPRG
jgi:hypothetical protein